MQLNAKRGIIAKSNSPCDGEFSRQFSHPKAGIIHAEPCQIAMTPRKKDVALVFFFVLLSYSPSDSTAPKLKKVNAPEISVTHLWSYILYNMYLQQ